MRIDLPEDADEDETAAIAAAVNAYVRAQMAVAADEDASDDRGWADRRWSYAGRIGDVQRRRVRVFGERGAEPLVGRVAETDEHRHPDLRADFGGDSDGEGGARTRPGHAERAECERREDERDGEGAADASLRILQHREAALAVGRLVVDHARVGRVGEAVDVGDAREQVERPQVERRRRRNRERKRERERGEAADDVAREDERDGRSPEGLPRAVVAAGRESGEEGERALQRSQNHTTTPTAKTNSQPVRATRVRARSASAGVGGEPKSRT